MNKTRTVSIRVDEDDYAKWKGFADANDMPLSTWIVSELKTWRCVLKVGINHDGLPTVSFVNYTNREASIDLRSLQIAQQTADGHLMIGVIGDSKNTIPGTGESEMPSILNPLNIQDLVIDLL